MLAHKAALFTPYSNNRQVKQLGVPGAAPSTSMPVATLGLEGQGRMHTPGYPTWNPLLQARRHTTRASYYTTSPSKVFYSLHRDHFFKTGRDSYSVQFIGTNTESQTKRGDRKICPKWRNKTPEENPNEMEINEEYIRRNWEQIS